MSVLHHYDHDGVYTGSNPATPRPKGVGLPANCTDIAPPEGEGMVPVWRGEAWELVAAATPTAPDLAVVKAQAETAIDARADALLAPYMSLTPGRAMTYLAKEAQATAFLAATDPDPAAYPLIAGEVGITADTARGVAEVIVAMAHAWHAMGASIESVRLAAKKQVGQAQTSEAVQAVLAGIVWPQAE